MIKYILSILLSGTISICTAGPNKNTTSVIPVPHSTNYGLTNCPKNEILATLNLSKAGILKCSVNEQTHYADVYEKWGKNTWINDLYFGLFGGLFISDQKEQDVFKAELRKIAPYVLSEDDTLEIVPYAVSADGKSFLRNEFSGVDYDRAAQYLLSIIRVYEFSGDWDFLEEMYPVMKRIINWLGKQSRDEDILLEGRSVPAPITGVGSCVSVAYIGDAVKNDYKDFGASMFYFNALKKFALVEELFGRQEEARKYPQIAEKLKEAINQTFWNESSKGYLAWIDENNVKYDIWNTGNNTHAVYCELADANQTSQIIDRLNENKDSLIDVVPGRVTIETFPEGFSSNPPNYYWNAGCWTLVAAPIMLAYRKVNQLDAALHTMNVLSSDGVAKTEYGFYESYWSNTGKPGAIEGLLMNNGGVLWGFYQGVLGIEVSGDKLMFHDRVPAELLPSKVLLRYRGADVTIKWKSAERSSATVNGREIPKKDDLFFLSLDPSKGEKIEIVIGIAQ